MHIKYFWLVFFIASIGAGCSNDDSPAEPLQVLQVFNGPTQLNIEGSPSADVPLDASLTVVFSTAVDRISAASAITLSKTGQAVSVDVNFSNADKTVLIRPGGVLTPNSLYTLSLSDQLQGAKGESFSARTIEFKTIAGKLDLVSLKANGIHIMNEQRPTDIAVQNLNFEITFSYPLDPATVDPSDFRITGFADVPTSTTFSNDNKTITVSATSTLSDLRKYELQISDDIEGVNDEPFDFYSKIFYTAPDPAPDFPALSDEALLTLVQEQTFKYFWDFAHPLSGMARERNSSGDVVTSGGSGFGIMTLIVGMERNFITRAEGLTRMDKILDFLETSDRFHGAWSHWINGSTGDVVPFSANDNGGDLVETSFLIQGLITFRQYLNSGVPAENALVLRINALWEEVEWDWYTKGENVLYWHWSPDKEWIMNHQIKGYNESLITYLLAASSPTHTITETVYHEGWASSGTIANGKTFYGINLPLGSDYGGPLFFTHYSFLGLDPRNLRDTYANYWDQNVNHTLINHHYAEDNPKNFVGFSDVNWGLTASDNHVGYSAHSPTNDLGIITPTAAVSSLPYAPDESMEAIKFFYYTVGDRLWGPYGFYDAFNLTEGWTADSYLAIDQGPIVVMIENHRTGLLWDLFMSAPEVQAGLSKLGFSY
jgi:hypothetical protein